MLQRTPPLQHDLVETWSPSPTIGKVGVFADIFNAVNQRVPLRILELSGRNFGVPLQWLVPRSLRAGVRLMF